MCCERDILGNVPCRFPQQLHIFEPSVQEGYRLTLQDANKHTPSIIKIFRLVRCHKYLYKLVTLCKLEGTS